MIYGTAKFLDWFFNWLIDWLIDWLCIGWLIDWLLIHWLIDWLLIHCLIDWLTAHILVDWLIDWLRELLLNVLTFSDSIFYRRIILKIITCQKKYSASLILELQAEHLHNTVARVRRISRRLTKDTKFFSYQFPFSLEKIAFKNIWNKKTTQKKDKGTTSRLLCVKIVPHRRGKSSRFSSEPGRRPRKFWKIEKNTTQIRQCGQNIDYETGKDK